MGRDRERERETETDGMWNKRSERLGPTQPFQKTRYLHPYRAPQPAVPFTMWPDGRTDLGTEVGAQGKHPITDKQWPGVTSQHLNSFSSRPFLFPSGMKRLQGAWLTSLAAVSSTSSKQMSPKICMVVPQRVCCCCC